MREGIRAGALMWDRGAYSMTRRRAGGWGGTRGVVPECEMQIECAAAADQAPAVVGRAASKWLQKGVSKEGGWDVEGGAEGGKENKTGRLSRRSGGVKAFSMGEVEMWKDAGEGRCAAGAVEIQRWGRGEVATYPSRKFQKTEPNMVLSLFLI